MHILKPHKYSTNSIILELNYKDRAASLLYYLYLYRIFNYFLIKLCEFQIESRGKNFGVPGPSSEMAGFQLRPPSYVDATRSFILNSGLRVIGDWPVINNWNSLKLLLT